MKNCFVRGSVVRWVVNLICSFLTKIVSFYVTSCSKVANASNFSMNLCDCSAIYRYLLPRLIRSFYRMLLERRTVNDDFSIIE